MDTLEADYLPVLLAPREPPCLSLYQPTHRAHPENKQDPIRFRNLVRRLEDSLSKRYTARETGPLLAPFRQLETDDTFWVRTLDGIAVLAAPGLFKVYRVQRPVPELAIVATSFHTKPLLRILQSADRYQILGVSRKEIFLYEGNRDAITPIEPLAGVPRTVEEVLGEKAGPIERKSRVYSGWSSGGGPDSATRHGTDVAQEVTTRQTEQFFRVVDRAVYEHCSRPSGLPLLLAALGEHQALFRRISRNPFLTAEGIEGDAGSFSPESLRERAWELLLPHYLERLGGLIERFREAASKGLGTDDVAKAAAAVAARRVGALLIDADKHVPGAFDPATGAIRPDNLADPVIDDVLDDLGECVIKTGGEVVIVPHERMPTQSGIAATFRF